MRPWVHVRLLCTLVYADIVHAVMHVKQMRARYVYAVVSRILNTFISIFAMHSLLLFWQPRGMSSPMHTHKSM